MRISLIIAAYNEEKYIGACLAHACKNSAGNLHEIIVVDNASTDNTAAIAATYPGVKIVTETKKGPTFARQRGYTTSTGDVLAFIDADTRMPSGWTQKIEDAFSAKRTLGIITGPYSFYDLPRYSRLYTWLYYTPRIAFVSSKLFGGFCTGGNFAIRRSVLDQMHGFNTHIVFYGDEADITRRAKKYGTIQYRLDFIMPTSARRYAHQGIISTGYYYIINYVYMLFFHKPLTVKYRDFR